MAQRYRSGWGMRCALSCARLLLPSASLGLLSLFWLANLCPARAGDGRDAQADLPQSLPATLYQLTDVGGLRSQLDRQGLQQVLLRIAGVAGARGAKVRKPEKR